MALLKIIPLAQNPDWSGEYLRADQVSYNRPARVLEIVLALYASKEAAENGCPPVNPMHDVIRIEGDDAEIVLAALHDDAGPLIYSILKARDAYADAANA